MRSLVRWGAPRWDGRRGSFPCRSRARCRLHRPLLWSILFALALLAGTAIAVHAQELTFSVAISMKEAVEELGRRFQRTRPDVVLRYNFGSSGELQKQIEAGAPVDLFVSAADRQMDELESKGLILAASRRTFARNALSAIVPADSGLGITRPVDLMQPHGPADCDRESEDRPRRPVRGGKPAHTGALGHLTLQARARLKMSDRCSNMWPAARWRSGSCMRPT